MTMDQQELRQLLEQLHTELEQAKNIDEKGQELLKDLSTDIRELLARSEPEQAQTSLLDRLGDSISYLEVTHPTLTNTLARILETLSNAGI
jgi:cytochrome c-type biogenesis protein CcmH/NrfF